MENSQPHKMKESGTNQEVDKCLEQLRQKLLDLSLRNTLLNHKETKRTIRIVDELPDITFKRLVVEQESMILLPMSDELRAETQIIEKEESPISFLMKYFHEKGGLFKSINTIESGFDKNFREKFGEDCINTLLHLKKIGIIDFESADKGLNIKLISEDIPNDASIKQIRNAELPKNEETNAKRHFDNKLQTPLTPSQLESRCNRLRLDAKTALEETGCNFLYLSIGFLEWQESDDSERCLRAPLILIPIEFERIKIKRRTDYFTYKISYTGEDILENISLAEKLSKDFGIALPLFKDNINPEEYFSDLNEVISHKKKWKIAREMIIGTFSFSKIVMYRDLNSTMWPSNGSINKHKLVNTLCTGGDYPSASILPGQTDIDEISDNFEYSLILDADSSQMHTIEQSMKGKDLVIHGPPGTGKSQTIANLIACAMSCGKSVLYFTIQSCNA